MNVSKAIENLVTIIELMQVDRNQQDKKIKNLQAEVRWTQAGIGVLAVITIIVTVASGVKIG